MELIKGQQCLYAIIFSAHESFTPDSTEFITEPDSILQVGKIARRAHDRVPLHSHNPVRRETLGTHEFLILVSGQIKLHLEDPLDPDFSHDVILESGDMVLLVNWAHSIDFLQDSEIIEVKSGPYANLEDKTFLGELNND